MGELLPLSTPMMFRLYCAPLGAPFPPPAYVGPMNVPVRSKAATVRLVRCFITFLPSGVHSFVATRQANSVPNVVRGGESDPRGSWRGTYRIRRVSGELRRATSKALRHQGVPH